MKIDYEFGGDDYKCGVPYEYEVDYQELKEAVVEILCRNVKYKQKSLYNEDGAYQMAMYLVNDLACLDSLCENLEDELHEYFYDKAEKDYEESIIEAKEIDSWYGTKNDVIGIYGRYR